MAGSFYAAPGAPRIITGNSTLRCPLKCSQGYVNAGGNEAEGVLSPEEAFTVAGNGQNRSFAGIWRNAPLYTALRDPSKLTGICGICRFQSVDGECQALAYRGADAFSAGGCDGPARPQNSGGNSCGEDPWCLYKSGEGTG
jgi:hypothetical protein